jgi:integrase
MLAEAYELDMERRYQWTVATGEWHVKRKSLSGSSKRQIGICLNRFIKPLLGDIVLVAINFDHLNDAIDMVWHGDGGSASYARSVGSILKMMLRWGAKHGWAIKPRLLSVLAELLTPPRRLPPPVNIEHVKACLRVVFGPRSEKGNRRIYVYRRALWPIFIANGPRHGEVAQLEWSDIDWARGVAEINKAHSPDDGLTKAPKSKAGFRDIWLPEQALL